MINALRDRGVIGHKTRVIPDAYTTQLQLVTACDRYYGFAIPAPKHAWPFYDQGEGWHPSSVRPASDIVAIATCVFKEGPIAQRRLGRVQLDVDPSVDIMPCDCPAESRWRPASNSLVATPRSSPGDR